MYFRIQTGCMSAAQNYLPILLIPCFWAIELLLHVGLMENYILKNGVRKLLWLESLVAKRSHISFPPKKNAGMSAGWRFRSKWTASQMGKLSQPWKLTFWMPIFKTLGKHKWNWGEKHIWKFETTTWSGMSHPFTASWSTVQRVRWTAWLLLALEVKWCITQLGKVGTCRRDYRPRNLPNHQILVFACCAKTTSWWRNPCPKSFDASILLSSCWSCAT